MIYILIPGSIAILLTTFLILPYGLAAGDIISRSVNRKRSKPLVITAGLTVITTFVLALQLPNLMISPFYGLVATFIGVILAIQPLRK